jgi:hypothetical protein
MAPTHTTFSRDGGTMSRVGSLNRVASLLCILQAACSTSGYRIRIESHGFARFDGRLMDTQEAKFEQHGFEIRGKRESLEAVPGEIASHFSKVLSASWHDRIDAMVLWKKWTSADQGVIIVIENLVRGQEPDVKREIDWLGDRCYESLLRAAGPSNVSIERRAASPPIAY